MRENTIERKLILTDHDIIDEEDVKLLPVDHSTSSESENFMSGERSILTDAVKGCEGNLSRAARKLGIARTTLQKKVKFYGIKKD